MSTGDAQNFFQHRGPTSLAQTGPCLNNSLRNVTWKVIRSKPFPQDGRRKWDNYNILFILFNIVLIRFRRSVNSHCDATSAVVNSLTPSPPLPLPGVPHYLYPMDQTFSVFVLSLLVGVVMVGAPRMLAGKPGSSSRFIQLFTPSDLTYHDDTAFGATPRNTNFAPDLTLKKKVLASCLKVPESDKGCFRRNASSHAPLQQQQRAPNTTDTDTHCCIRRRFILNIKHLQLCSYWTHLFHLKTVTQGKSSTKIR